MKKLLLNVGCDSDIVDHPMEGCINSEALNYDINAEKGWGVDIKQYLLDLEQ